jgi:hypothetical protein
MMALRVRPALRREAHGATTDGHDGSVGSGSGSPPTRCHAQSASEQFGGQENADRRTMTNKGPK